MKKIKLFLSIILVVNLNYLCFSLEEIYLSAVRTAYTPTRYNILTRYIPLSASVVTKEDILMTNSNQTTDILGQLPGVFIRKTSAFGRADVDIRGMGDNGRQIGVLVDGRPDKMSIFSCSVTHTLPMNNVERIEIIRGPESVLYGSEAFGGAVNIITRRAKEKFEGSFLSSYGTFNTQNYRLQQGSKFEKLDYFISIDRRLTDGHKENSMYNATDYTGQIGYKIAKNTDLSFSGKYFSGTKNEPLPSPAGTWNNYDRGSVDFTLESLVGEFDNSIKIYRSFGEHKFSDGFHSKDFTDGLMIHTRTSFLLNNEISLGIDYRNQVGEILNTSPTSFIGEYKKYEYGIYIDDKHTFFNKLSLQIGSRYNYDEISKEFFASRIGLIYNFSQGTILRGVWSEGFRPPAINDLYLWAGNKNLKPEKVTNTEIGIRQFFGENIYFDIGGYIMKGLDLIEVRSGKKVNIGEFEFKGVETICNIKFNDNFNSQFNYTYMDVGKKTAGRPGNKAGLSLIYREQKVSGLLGCDYVGNYYASDDSQNKINDYFLVNTKLNYKLISNIDIFISVENITDVEYKIFYSGGLYTMPKRTVNMGMIYTF